MKQFPVLLLCSLKIFHYVTVKLMKIFLSQRYRVLAYKHLSKSIFDTPLYAKELEERKKSYSNTCVFAYHEVCNDREIAFPCIVLRLNFLRSWWCLLRLTYVAMKLKHLPKYY